MNAVVLAASLQEEENVIPQKRGSAPGEALEGVALIAGAINSTPLQAASLGTFWAEPESTAPGRDPSRRNRAGTDREVIFTLFARIPHPPLKRSPLSPGEGIGWADVVIGPYAVDQLTER